MTSNTTHIGRPLSILGFLALAFVIAHPDKGQAQSLAICRGLVPVAKAIESQQETLQPSAKKPKPAQEESSPAAPIPDSSLQSIQSKSGKNPSGGQEHIESVSQNYIPKADIGGNLVNTVAPIFETTDGKVGIGTTTPNSGLAVYQTQAAGRVNIDFLNNAAADTADRVRLRLGPFNGFHNTDLHPYIESYVQIGPGSGSSGLAFGTYNAEAFSVQERMRIDKSGNVGIGTTSPAFDGNSSTFLGVANATAHQFSEIGVGGNATGTTDVAGSFAYYNSSLGTTDKRIAAISGAADGATNSGNLQFYTWNAGTLGERVRIDKSGNVGIGTSNPLTKLHLNDPSNQTFVVAQGVGAAGITLADAAGPVNAKWYQWRSEGGLLRMALVNDALTGFVNYNIMVANSNGDIGIGTNAPSAKLHVVGAATITGAVSTGNINATGDITATGNIAARYQDVAEWVPASRAIPAGSVVVLDAEQSNHVLPSSRAYDTRVAGVVSASPGVILGEGGAGKVMVATTGRVRVKVDATLAPIRVGDLLVTSDKEGIAMRSQPLELAGTPIHRPGTLIGKALEPLEKGVGEILVLLSLQ